MSLESEDWLREATALMATETHQQLMSIALEEFVDAHSGGATQWEFEHNKHLTDGAKEFLSFLNKMVLDRVEKVAQEEEDDEPRHADPN